MKIFLVFFFSSLLIASCAKAQDTIKIDSDNTSTISIQPLVGLGLINGLRVGPAISFNDLITVEAGIGIGFINVLGLVLGGATDEEVAISEGITYSPSRHKDGFVLSLYHLSHLIKSSKSYFVEAQVGWKGWLGKKEFYRISAGYGQRYYGNGGGLDNPHLFVDIVLYIGALRIGL